MKKKKSKFFTEKNIFIIIGIILIIHWILLVIARTRSDFLANLFWVSHLALLLAGIGFILKSNLLLTGSLISVVIVHGFWIYDFLVLLITGNSPLDYASYFPMLTIYGKFLTIHHIYLIPLLLVALWRQKKVSICGWLVASVLFAFSTIASFLFLSKEYNINCAHYICDIILKVLPFLGFLTNLNPIVYLLMLNLLTDIFVFLLFNVLLYYSFVLIQK